MMDFLLSENDLKIDADFLLTQSLSEQVEQALRIQLKTLQGEWFLDERVGIPYFTEILGQKPHKLTLLGIFREAILKVEGVAEIISLDCHPGPEPGSKDGFQVKPGMTRTVQISFEVELNDGSRVKLHV